MATNGRGRRRRTNERVTVVSVIHTKHLREEVIASVATQRIAQSSFVVEASLAHWSHTCQDIILAAKEGVMDAIDAANRLDVAIRKFMTLHQRVYGAEFLRPKHHWMMDVPDQLRRDGMVLDAFVVERQHLVVKRVAENVKNLKKFEASVLASLVLVQSQQARETTLRDGLIGQSHPLQEMPSVMVSKKMVVHSVIEIAVGDVISRGLDFGFVLGCADDDGDLFFFVARTVTVRADTTHAATVRRTNDVAIWRATEVQQCLAWRQESADVVLVLSR